MSWPRAHRFTSEQTGEPELYTRPLLLSKNASLPLSAGPLDLRLSQSLLLPSLLPLDFQTCESFDDSAIKESVDRIIKGDADMSLDTIDKMDKDAFVSQIDQNHIA